MRLGLFIVYGKSYTGGPRVVANLAPSLAELGQRVVVITNRESPMTEELLRKGISVRFYESPAALDQSQGSVLKDFRLMLKAGWALIRCWGQIHQICRQEEIEALWVRNIKGVLIAGPPTRWLGKKVIWDLGMEYRSKGIVYILHTIGLLLSNVLVAEGGSVYGKIFTRGQRWLFRRKLKVVPSAIPIERQRCIENARADKNDVPKVDEGRVRVFYPASIQDRKNQALLLEAMMLLERTAPRIASRVGIRFAGPVVSEEYNTRLQELTARLDAKNRIEFLGWRDDIPQLLATCDIFCLVSKNEGVPYAVLEAMHAGLPLIVSDVGGFPDVVQHGATGLIVPADSPLKLAEALKILVSDDQKRANLGNAACAFVRNHHTQKAWIDSYMEVLRALSTSQNSVR